MSYARRQQYRRLSRAGAAGFGSAGAALLALLLASLGTMSLALVPILAAFALGLYARHWLGLAGRSGVGARSEDQVRDALAILESEGWRLRHSLPWLGPGDIDSVAIAPTGIAFAIETKTRTYEERHLTRVGQQAAWLQRRRRRWCRQGALPVLCVTRGGGPERCEGHVAVVSIHRLVPFLRATAGASASPHVAFRV